MTTHTDTPAHLAVCARLDALVAAGRIGTYGVTDRGRYFIRTTDGRRIANLTVGRTADLAALADSI